MNREIFVLPYINCQSNITYGKKILIKIKFNDDYL